MTAATTVWSSSSVATMGMHDHASAPEADVATRSACAGRPSSRSGS
jgi:hypothetical protein